MTAQRPLRGRECLVAVLVFTILACAVTWPLVTQLQISRFGPTTDYLEGIWFQWYQAHANWQVFGTSHIGLLGAPLGYTQDYAVFLNQQLMMISGYLMTQVAGPVAAMSLLVISGIALSGFAMYIFARVLGVGVGAAFWAGVVFAIFPWHLERATDAPPQAHLWGFPLLALVGWLWYQQPTLRRALAMGGALVLMLLTDPYIGLMGTLLWILILLIGAFGRYRASGRRTTLHQLLVAVAATAWAPVLIFGYQYYDSLTSGGALLRFRQTFITSADVSSFAARWYEFVTPVYANPFLSSLTRRIFIAPLHGSNIVETSLFLGFVTIGLAAVFCVLAIARRQSLSPAERFAGALGIVTALVGFAMALATSHSVAGVTFPSPGQALFAVAPYWRVYSRFVALVMFGVLTLAVLALERVYRRVPRRLGPIIILVALGLSYVELAHNVPVIPIGPTPAVYQTLARIEPGAAVVEYPMYYPFGQGEYYLLWQTVHHHPIVNEAPPGSVADAFRQDVDQPSDPSVPHLLAFAGVKLAVVHGAPVRLNGFTRIYTSRTSDAQIYRVAARPADGAALFLAHSDPSTTGAGTQIYRWLIGSPAVVGVWVRHAGLYDITAPAQSFQHNRRLVVQGLSHTGGTFLVHATLTLLHFQLRLTSGVNMVNLITAGATFVRRLNETVSIRMYNWTIVGPLVNGPSVP